MWSEVWRSYRSSGWTSAIWPQTLLERVFNLEWIHFRNSDPGHNHAASSRLALYVSPIYTEQRTDTMGGWLDPRPDFDNHTHGFGSPLADFRRRSTPWVAGPNGCLQTLLRIRLFQRMRQSYSKQSEYLFWKSTFESRDQELTILQTGFNPDSPQASERGKYG